MTTQRLFKMNATQALEMASYYQENAARWALEAARLRAQADLLPVRGYTAGKAAAIQREAAACYARSRALVDMAQTLETLPL